MFLVLVKNFFEKTLTLCSKQDTIKIKKGDIMSNIGENIRKYRKARGMSQEQLSFEVGVKRAVISKYENGFIAPSLAMIEKIAKALDVTISEIYIGL